MRTDRIYELKHMASYCNSDIFDMVFYYPESHSDVRMWLLSEAKEVQVNIDDVESLPCQVIKGENNQYYSDYGVVSIHIGFHGQMRVKGISYEELQNSYLIITKKLDFVPKGSLVEVQRQLWGLAKVDAGSSVIKPSRVPVRDAQRFTATYTAGEKGLLPGSRVRFSVPFAFSRPQYDRSEEAGYIHLLGEYEKLTPISIKNGVESHERYYIVYEFEKGLLPNEAIKITYQTENVYMYPQKYLENEMVYWYTRTPVLNVAVANGEAGEFVNLLDENAHSVEFYPQSPSKLNLFLPGRVHLEMPVVLRGTFTDRYNNVAYGSRPNLNFKLCLHNDNKVEDLGDAARYFNDFHSFNVPLTLHKAGIYRVSAVDCSGKTIAISNPMQILEKEDARPNIYWGEIHAHSGMSDGIGGYRELYRHAYEDGCLDFVAATDHACYFTDNEWEIMQDITNSFNVDGKFTTLIGYEWAGKQVHRNIYTSQSRLKLFRGMYPPTSQLDSVYNTFDGDENIVAGPHGSIAHGLRFQYHNPQVERFIEIYSMWGAQDYIGNPHTPIENSSIAVGVNSLLKEGAHLGFTGGGDCHEGHAGFSCYDEENQGILPHTFAQNLRYKCGLTAVCAKELNRKEVIGALRNHQTYATTGVRILGEFSINGYPMGSIVSEESSQINLDAEIHLCSPKGQLFIVKNGEIVYECSIEKSDFQLVWQDVCEKGTENSYYIKVIQSDGNALWLSPIWIKN